MSPWFAGPNPNRFLRTTTCVVRMSGSNCVQFTAPASLLSRISVPIEALVNDVVNGTNASASIDVDGEGSFYRFCQFVFTGTYDGFSKPENEDCRDCFEGIAPYIAETCIEPIAPVRLDSSQSPGGSLFGNIIQLPSTGRFGVSESTGGGGLLKGKAQAPSFGGGGLFGDKTQVPSFGGGGGLFGGKTQASGFGIFGSSESAGGGGVFGGKNQASSFGMSGSSESAGGSGLFGGKTQAPSTGLFGSSETTGSEGGSRVRSGLQLPYSLLSYRGVLNKATTSKPRPKKRKHEDLEDSDDAFHLSFKSRAISTFLLNYGQMDLFPSTANGRQRSLGSLLGHAKMWHMAEKYVITTMMDVAGSRFSHELAHWVINVSEFVKDFGRVVGYLYHNRTGDNALQLLIAQFAACIVEDVKDLDGWAELLKDVPAFCQDLNHALVKVYWSKKGN